jgi:Cu(I)/Ag(I) efflux system periplasmic protein CusF
MLARAVLVGLASASLAGATAAAAPLAPARPTGGPAVLLVHEGHGGAAQATGTVNAVDTARHTVNLSHGAIKALGWPAMTMDFPVGPDVDLAAVKPGMRVNFTLVRGGNGQYQVDTIQPAATAAGR